MAMTFSQQENIGFRYVINSLSCSSPYGQARVSKLRFFDPKEIDELKTQLSNVCRVKDTLTTASTSRSCSPAAAAASVTARTMNSRS